MGRGRYHGCAHRGPKKHRHWQAGMQAQKVANLKLVGAYARSRLLPLPSPCRRSLDEKGPCPTPIPTPIPTPASEEEGAEWKGAGGMLRHVTVQVCSAPAPKSRSPNRSPPFQMRPSVSRSILDALAHSMLSDEDKVSDGGAGAISAQESIPGSGLHGVVQLGAGQGLDCRRTWYLSARLNEISVALGTVNVVA